ncbi:MAG: ABC transporter ATP-binding protein [Janthinobacterium lividum]|uniref:ABC transporter ATP-binding protein n=1 Tax=Pseudomonas sp. MWU16-30317 TaxID=2878095 RepID=UPI001CFB60E9|nr:ABC transporter ATP-binding protein [Pseudomonas sp. MWU16-30317]
MSTQHRISLTSVSKRFASPGHGKPDTEVLRNVSLSLADGEFVCLLGPSGCGKSTILNMVAGFEHADSGAVLLDGKPITQPGPERGVVFQQPTLFPWLNVQENIAFGPRITDQPKAAYQQQVNHYLEQVGLVEFADHYPWQLSGGMRQRAALARAWLPNPEILLMDEPFGALDAQTRLEMQELLVSIWERTRTTILFVTHDIDEALFLADRILVMSARPGVISEELKVPFERPRTPEDLVADPVYGGLKRDILHVLRQEAGKRVAAGH